MKCHYEVLNIPRTADESEIKTAYKKLALKWHPDKNLDNTDEAKEQFQLVQQAYEVLIDRQERAWYDNHREQILRGADKDFEDNSLDVFQYFTTSCFKGYNDDDKGFYCVYRNVFDQIAKEDLEYMDDKKEFLSIPSFGDSKSDYDTVVAAFYNHWLSYSTKKSYVWLDPYNINEARERRVLKLIEKENKKVRTKAKKERNEEVRNLVMFVRKRDKRVQEHARLLEEQVKINRQKHQDIKNRKRLERFKDIHESSRSEADWTKFDNVQDELKEIEKSLAEEFGEVMSDENTGSDEDDESRSYDLYCAACEKVFKTAKAFGNHESSKKHKENVEKLKAIMAEDDQVDEESDFDENASVGSNDSLSTESDEEVVKSSKRKSKKNKNVLRVESGGEEETLHELLIQSENEIGVDNNKSKKKKRRNKKKGGEEGAIKEISEDVDDEDDNRKNVTSKKVQKKKGGKKQSVKNTNGVVNTDNTCATCRAVFESKNKLFDHLKKTKHSVYLNKVQSDIKE